MDSQFLDVIFLLCREYLREKSYFNLGTEGRCRTYQECPRLYVAEMKLLSYTCDVYFSMYLGIVWNKSLVSVSLEI